MPRTSSDIARRTRWAYLVWGAAMLAYIATVAGRSSIGVASVQAMDRFHVGAGALSVFGAVQLGTYAAAQFPAGLLLDRFGPRRMLLIGSAVMLVGQTLMALTPLYPLAVLARVLIGAGDAAIFISVIRLIAAWFRPRMAPLFTQLTGVLGQSGQVIAAVPFFAVLLSAGWSAAFGMIAALLLVGALAVLLLVHDEPAGDLPTGAIPVVGASPRPVLRDVLTSPGAWAGMFAHWVTLFSVNVYVVMWGVPLLTQGHGATPGTVSLLLSIQVLAGMVFGPVIGALSGRFPQRRVLLVAVTVAVHLAGWIVMLAWPGQHSTALLIAFSCTMALGAAASGLGFDLARTGVSPMSVGTATGFVNIGGFGAGLVGVLIVGMMLEALAPGRDAALADHRLSWAALAVPMAAGLIGFAVAVARGGARPAPERRAGGSIAAPIAIADGQAGARAGSGPAA
ncbi:MFS transporter [Brachybacterium sp. JHP9]|uniref:MFS transporter n=1 Tax=Brachybacterium equifaecis TaxID=2910770 RepID=A0ABT0R393_9MICO|nr:MFS transporter [Brachybacterium equifaecis]MCL6424209.1 MFS transporter [Brachybacterium equifaecis]